MADFDVFNGDADGLCALLQLQHADPREACLVTGVKRDISLLERVQAGAGDRVRILDVSLDKNRDALRTLLDAGAQVFYCDHHHAGEIPESASLETLINTEATVCTSLLVNGRLQGAFAAWAVVGACGDNLRSSAEAVARTLDLGGAEIDRLDRLGVCLNYNGYGTNLEDLHWDPADLFRELAPYADPRDFLAHREDLFEALSTGYDEDMANAAAVAAESESAGSALFLLPDAPWARRVSGVFGNRLANEHPERAHAVATWKPGGGLVISVRAPLKRRSGTDELCRRFATGGGRAAAAGINHLEEADLGRFREALRAQYG